MPALLAALALPACSDGDAAAAPPAGDGGFKIPVTWAAAEAGDVAETVELVGDVLSHRWAQLAFERAGRVTAVVADLGDEVRAGQLLARLDDAVLQQELAVAQAVLDNAQAGLDWARREAERSDRAGTDVLSASEQDRRNVAEVVARANLAQRQAELLRLKELLAQGELKAPFDGVVASRDVTEGGYAAVGRPAFTLVDLLHREVHLEIPAAVAAGLSAGAPVSLRLDEAPELLVRGRLDELVPAADLSSRTFKGVVRLDGLDDARRLLPGLFVRARIEKQRVQGRAVVPVDAVLQNEAGSYVVLMEMPGPTARITPVRVLARDDERAAVASVEPGALQTGARVIVTGADNVFPGAPLAPVPALDSAAAAAGSDAGGDAGAAAAGGSGSR